MYYVHPYTVRELEYLRNAYEPHASRPRRRRRRPAAWRQRVRGMLRERPQLTVFTLDADDAAQLAHDGAK
jgi:hypothetical protein